MSCLCEPNTLVCVRMSPCNSGTTIDLQADVSGTWTVNIEFNGAYRYFGLEVTEDEDIILPTIVLNENYIHQTKFYREDGSEFGCYKLQTQLTQNVSGSPLPPAPSGSWDWHTLAVNGNTVVSPYLEGELSPIIFLDSNPIEWATQGITWDSSTGTLDFTAIGGFIGDVTFQYRNLP